MPTTADEAFYAVAVAFPGLTSLVGGVSVEGSFRCYPGEAPEGAEVPFLIFEEISSPSLTTHDEGVASRLDRCAYRTTAFAATQLEAKRIIYQLRLALEQSALKAIKLDERSVPRADDANCFGQSADFQFWNYPDS